MSCFASFAQCRECMPGCNFDLLLNRWISDPIAQQLHVMVSCDCWATNQARRMDSRLVSQAIRFFPAIVEPDIARFTEAITHRTL